MCNAARCRRRSPTATDRPHISPRSSALALSVAVAALALTPASAFAITVTSTADDGPGTLRDAVATANASGADTTIDFAPALSGETITLTSGPLVVNKPTGLLEIDGSALASDVDVSGANTQALLDVQAGNATIDRLTLRDGLGAAGAAGAAGTVNGGNGGNAAVFNRAGATLTITNSTLSGLVGGAGGAGGPGDFGGTGQGGGGGGGGAVMNDGSMTLLSSTMTASSGGAGGTGGQGSAGQGHTGGGGGSGAGAITNLSGGTFTIRDSTVTQNTGGAGGVGGQAFVFGGGGGGGAAGAAVLNASGGSLTIENSTVAANSSGLGGKGGDGTASGGTSGSGGGGGGAGGGGGGGGTNTGSTGTGGSGPGGTGGGTGTPNGIRAGGGAGGPTGGTGGAGDGGGGGGGGGGQGSGISGPKPAGAAGSYGGGAVATGTGGSVSVTSTILSDSAAPVVHPDCRGAIATGDSNIVEDVTGCTRPVGDTLAGDPGLAGAGLASNGGPTQTIALTNAGQAIDNGANPAALAFDQRGAGFPRVIGPSPDIGAYEADVMPVTVTKALVPSADAGRFDLKVDSTVVRASAGDGQSGTAHVTTGASATVSEVAAAATDLADYVTSIDCGAAGSGTGSSLVLASVTAATTCTITNTRRPEVTVVKALTPSSDAGRFDLLVGSTVVKAGAGDGEQGSTTVVRGSDVTVSEVSASGPGLAAYDSSVDCGSGPTGGTTLTLTNVTADVTCTITNTRRPTVTVVKALTPAADAGRFDLRVGSTVVKAGAGDGEQGSTTVVRGSDVTVSEVSASGAGPAAYDSTIDCGSGAVAGTTRTLTNVTADVTCTITNTRKSDPPPPPPPAPPPPGAPAMTALNITPKTFAPESTAVTFTLSRPATVTYRVDRVLEGKERRGRCTVSGASRKSGKRCIRYDQIAKLTASGVTGTNRFTLDAKQFGPGRYRLRVVAQTGTDSSPELSVRFRIT